MSPSRGTTPIGRWRKAARWGATLTLLMVAALLAFPSFFLRVSHRPESCDAIVLLGGGYGERELVAARLYTNGLAPWVVVTGIGDCEDNRRALMRLGVPARAILTECDSRSTHENALLTVPMLRARKFHRITLVTSWFHSRRTLSTFQRTAPDLVFRSVVSTNNYAFQRCPPHVAMEYLKILYYAGRWRVWPVV